MEQTDEIEEEFDFGKFREPPQPSPKSEQFQEKSQLSSSARKMRKNDKKQRKETLEKLEIEEASRSDKVSEFVFVMIMSVFGTLLGYGGLTEESQLASVVLLGMGIGSWLIVVGVLWARFVYYPFQKRIFVYISKNTLQMKQEASRWGKLLHRKRLNFGFKYSPLSYLH